MNLLTCDNGRIRILIVKSALPNLIANSNNPVTIKRVWDKIVKLSNSRDEIGLTAAFSLLAATYEHLFHGQLAQQVLSSNALYDLMRLGLVSNNGVFQKYALFVLKRLVSDAHDLKSKMTHTRFLAPVDDAMWKNFFLVYETIRENRVYLVEPIIPRVKQLLISDTLPLFWKYLILETGLGHDSMAISRLIYSTLFKLEGAELYESDTFWNAFLRPLNTIDLFVGSAAAGSLVSPFGDGIQMFISRTLMLYRDCGRLLEIIFHQLTCYKNDVSIFYVLAGVVDFLQKSDFENAFEHLVRLFLKVSDSFHVGTLIIKDTFSRMIKYTTVRLCPRMISVDLATDVCASLQLRIGMPECDMIVSKVDMASSISKIISFLDLFFNGCTDSKTREEISCLSVIVPRETRQNAFERLISLDDIGAMSLAASIYSKCSDVYWPHESIDEFLIRVLDLVDSSDYEAGDIIDMISSLIVECSSMGPITERFMKPGCSFETADVLKKLRILVAFQKAGIASPDLIYDVFAASPPKGQEARAKFLGLKWQCIWAFTTALKSGDVAWIDHVLQDLDLVCLDELVLIFHFTTWLLTHVPSSEFDGSKIQQLVNYCWHVAKSAGNTAHGSSRALESVFPVIFHPTVFLVLGTDSARDAMAELLSMDLSTRPSISAAIANWFFASFESNGVEQLNTFYDEFLAMTTFGTPRPSRSRFDDAIQAKETSLFEDLPQPIFSHNPNYVRLVMCKILLRMSATDTSHTEFATRIAQTLLNGMLKRKKSSVSGPRSHSLMLKLRALQIVLLCTDLVPSNSIESIFDSSMQLLSHGSTPETRLMLEWIMTRLILRDNHLATRTLEPLKTSHMRSVTCPSSLLAVARHIGPHMADDAVRVKWFEDLFSVVPCWCMHSQHLVRLFAAETLRMAVDCCTREPRMECFTKDRTLLSLVHISEVSPEYQQARRRQAAPSLDDDFWNLETLFGHLWFREQVADDELVSIDAFCRLEVAKARVPLRRKSPIGSFTCNRSVETKTLETVDFQKKIAPWEEMKQMDMDFGSQLGTTTRQPSALIVVASLVEKVPNLGGLCRTCEIFNAAKLVVHDRKVTATPDFKSLAVSSDAWMDIDEVRTKDLPRYLKDKKDQGYAILGLEQTAKSVSLVDYTFPEKSVLLLGREKTGIPAELLAYIDQAIEIPQYGITRSLNVHVSGALCIYEYAKQNH